MNKQREAVYGLRRRLLEGLDQKDLIIEDYVSGDSRRHSGAGIARRKSTSPTGTSRA